MSVFRMLLMQLASKLKVLFLKIVKGNSVQSKLPDGYTQLEYIQNDTNSYIKTGVLDGTDDMSYEVDFTYVSGSGYQYVLGAYGGDDKTNTVLYINTTKDIGGWINKAFSADAMTPDIIVPNQRLKCYADSAQFIVNGITKTKFKEGTQRAGAEIYLFRRNGDGNNTSAQTTSNAIIRLHSLKFKNKGVEVRKYIPAKRNSDNVLGLYDLVSNTFLINAGTGSFIADGAILPSPSNPQEVESVGDRTKNLFDANNAVIFKGYISASYSGKPPVLVTSSTGFTLIIPIKPSTTYTISKIADSKFRVATFVNYPTVEQTASVWNTSHSTSDEITITSSKDDAYMTVFYADTTTQNTEPVLRNSIQIEEGDTATVYEPYGYRIPVKVENVTTNVYLDEPLRKVDIHTDYIDFKNQKLNKEIKELKFTGYEDWFTSSSAGKHYYSIPKSALGTDLPHGSDDILCTHFKVFAGDISALPVGQVCVGNNNINFNFDGTNDDIAGFETWLSQNDVKLYYPLSTPVEEAVTLPQIEVPIGAKVEFLTKIQPSEYEVK